jgi:hypothetical protein
MNIDKLSDAYHHIDIDINTDEFVYRAYTLAGFGQVHVCLLYIITDVGRDKFLRCSGHRLSSANNMFLPWLPPHRQRRAYGSLQTH